MKKLLTFLTNRIVVSIVCLIVQIVCWLVMVSLFNEYFSLFYTICIILTVVALLVIINKNSNPAYKLAWIIPILLFPVFGGLFYATFAGNRLSKQQRIKMQQISYDYKKGMRKYKSSTSKLINENLEAGIVATFLERCVGVRSFENTQSEYLKIGEEYFQSLLNDLKSAKKFIFLEYFIIHEGFMWSSILDILKEKVNEGVDVRLIYDDLGCIFTLPSNYAEQMEKIGIKCVVFNKLTPKLTFKYNNRDHRKICVIDGNIGYTGGINLSDEYINKVERFGHWKDCGIVLRGKAVWNLTVMFLSMWNYKKSIDEDDFTKYAPDEEYFNNIKSDGYIIPYTDSPLDNEPVGENVYLQLINRAKKYVYINTPYLIIDNEMITSLVNCAKSGVDVVICTPHIADKLLVHAMTRSYYDVLIKAGVKIYEYTPGFLHSKTFVVDDIYAVVGTINLDYRSLYLHYECAVWLYNASCIDKIKKDYLETIALSEKIGLEYCKNQSKFKSFLCSLLKVFAPLM